MENNKPSMLKWNWGAFMMPFQFGVGNRAYLCLLSFVPILSCFWAFVAGFKGASWAYNSGEFATDEEFDASMRTWNRAGFVSFVVCAISLLLIIISYAAIFAILMGSLSAYPEL